MSTVRYFGVQRDAYVQVDLEQETIQEFTDESYSASSGPAEPATQEELTLARGQIIVDPSAALVLTSRLNEIIAQLETVAQTGSVSSSDFDAVNSIVSEVLASFVNLQNQGPEALATAVVLMGQLAKVLLLITGSSSASLKTLSTAVSNHDARLRSLEGL